MKTFKKSRLLVTALLLVISINSFGQFSPALVSEVAFGPGINGRATGNDIIEVAGDIFEVSVWDDNLNADGGIGWTVYASGGPYTGWDNFAISSTAWDPDVCLIYDEEYVIVRAILTYYDLTANAYVIESWEWNGSAFVYVDDFNTGSINFGTTVNIDSDALVSTLFVVVFDEGGTNDLFALTGDANTGMLSMHNSGNPVNFGSVSGQGLYPDVCFSSGSSKRVTYTYIDLDTPGNLIVDWDDFNNLAAGTASTANDAIEPVINGGNIFLLPRIACPNNANTSTVQGDWTVVVMEYDASTFWGIYGFNMNNGTPSGPILYNDGLIMGANTTGDPNTYPVVAYSNDGNNAPSILVGWSFNNFNNNYGGPPPTDALYSIVIRCDDFGAIVTDFMEVPTTINSLEAMDHLSLSGCDVVNALHFTYINQTVPDVYSKTVPNISGVINLRNESTLQNLLSDECLHSEIYDVTGKLLLKLEGTKFDIRNQFSSIFQKGNNPSIYIIIYYASNGAYESAEKICR